MINSEVRSHQQKARKLKPKAIENRKAPVLICFMFFAVCCMLPFLSTAANAKVEPGLNTITDIEVSDYAVKIKTSGPIKYRLNKSDDPFRVNIDLENTSIGKFKDKIFSYKTGITEITPFQIENPYKAARLDILLQSLSDVRPELKDNMLTLFVEHKDEVAAASSDDQDEEDGPDGETAGEITNVMLEKTEKGTEFVLRGDGPMPDPAVFEMEGRLVIDVPGVDMNATMPSKMLPPVNDIRYREDKDKVRFILNVEANSERSVFTLDDEVIVNFPAKIVPLKNADLTKNASGKQKPVTETGAQQAELKNQRQSLVSLDFQDADIIPILRLLSDVSGYNIVVHPDVKGKITMKLMNVPWEQAMDIVLKTFGLEKSMDGNVIRIAPISVFVKEWEDNTKYRTSEIQSKAAESVGIVEPRTFPINFADVSLVESTIKNAKVLSSRGSISSDKRTSTMVVYDIPAIFPYIEKLLETLDKPTPQVLIEARIVEINTSNTNDLGIQWGLNYKPNTDLFSVGGLSGLSRGPFTGNSFAVDFPGSSGVGSGSGITFGILNPARTLGLDVQLSALESVSKGKIISTPRIVTLDSEKAKIMQGTSEPYPQLSGTSGNVSAAFKDVALTVEVTPHITPDGSVGMELSVVKEDILSTVQISGSQVPRTSKVESKTKVLIQSGETIVIGGVQRKNETDASSGVPLLKNIPVLGWLFKNKSSSDRTSELLIFITPRIMEKTAVVNK